MNQSPARLLLAIFLAATLGHAADEGETKKLHQLLDEEWEHTMERAPTWASQLGDRRWNDRWADLSLEAIAREHEHDARVLARADGIRRDALSPADQVNYDMFRLDLAQSLEGFRFGGFLMPLDQRAGIQTEDELGDALRFETVQDYDDWISRLWAFSGYMDQTVALLREGMRRGLVQPKITMQRVPAQIDKQLVATPEESPFFKPLQRIPQSLPAGERERLTTAARAAVRDSVLPAFQRFREFFTGEYLPACLDGVGAWRWPDGEAMYAFLAREYTTTTLPPKEIHEIGLREVARIRGAMEKVKTQAGFAGTLPEFFAFLRTDPRFYCADEKQLLLEYQATAKRIDPTLVKLFRTLPRAPYGVEAIPAKMAPDTTAAYYRPLAADGSRAGTYFVNTYKPESRPRWEMMALSLHEAVPGHHLQFALAQEQGTLPRFRQHASYTGYVEGWALYAESLGDELGLYDDVYSKFGQHAFEMWRAIRLVVDTGIHALRWDRDRAIAFFRENSPRSEQDIVNEVDRYISWPGQALAYKIGELKIKELRARATAALGEKFDVKEFHDIILLGGAMPLSLLEARVDEWLRSRKVVREERRPRLQILNGSTQPIEVFWLKSDAERVQSSTIAPGKNTIITTTLGHRFAIVGGNATAEVTSEVPVQAFRFGGVPALYSQRVEAHGFPIVASAKVNAYALKEAAYIVDLMLAKRPDLRAAMIKSGARLCIMAHDEFTTDLPEWAHLTPKDYRDARARGMGGSETDPFCSCAEENVLGFPGDPYSTECILIHEFAHNIHLRGMVNVDPTFDTRLKAAYDAAMKAGLWKAAYASTNHHEYFAEGVQSWFDNNRFNDNEHNHVHLRAQLIEYDPGLAALCREVFGDTELKYTRPATRLTGHMAGYDPASAPAFAWPERLEKVKLEIGAQVRARNDVANGAPSRETREIAGWSVRVGKALLDADRAGTEHALELLKAQLDEIVRVVPAPAVTELRKVPLYVSPAYPGVKPKAEYHPDAGWLREHGRDPAMAKGVEFTNVSIFDAEVKRMPVFVLHELAHAYHDRVFGYEHAEIAACYERAKASKSYDAIARHRTDGGPDTIARAYAMTNPMEYFAETSEAFFGENDFFPFNRADLARHDPEMFVLLAKLWGVPATH